MNNLPAWLTTAQVLWMAIGVFVTTIATNTGICIPSFLTDFFSQDVWDAFIAAFGAVTALYQVVRAVFAANQSGSEVGVRSLRSTSKVGYFLNPFKT